MKTISFPYDEYNNHKEWIKTIDWFSTQFDYETNTITIKYKEK
jgi:hypothetical protein